MINPFWRLIADLLSRPAVAAWLIARAKRTPYLHIQSKDGNEIYMGRWWLFTQSAPAADEQRAGS